MKKTLTVFVTLAFILISFNSYTYRSGPGGGYADAPGGNDCGNGSCHNVSLTKTGSAIANITLDNTFTGGGYIPDSTYTMTLKYKQSSKSRWGFNLTALAASDDSPAGTVNITSNRTQKRTKTISGKSRTYVEHTSNGTSSVGSNATEWEFEWKAPSTNVGTIKFYSVVMASDASGGKTGDQIYAKVFNISPSKDLPVATAGAKSTTVCVGETVSLTGGVTNKPSQYSWVMPNGTPSVSTKQNPTTSYATSGKHKAYFRAKNAKGWSNTDTVYLDVKDAPSATIFGNTTRTICPGDSTELIASYHATYTYLWSDGQTGSNKVYVKGPGDYYVTVGRKAGGCSQTSNTIKVEHHKTAAPSITSSNTGDSVCKNETIVLTGGSGYDSLGWFDKGVWLGRTTGLTYGVNVDTGSSFRVRGWTSQGCLSDFSDSIEYEVIQRDMEPTVTCADREPFSLAFEWTGVSGHDGVQVSEDGGKTWNRPTSGAKGSKHELTGLTPDEDYSLWVRAVTASPCYYSETAKAVCKTGKCSPLEVSLTADTTICSGDEVNVELNGLKDKWYSLSFESGGQFTDTIFQFSPQNEAVFTVEVLDSAYLGCPAKKLTFPVHIDEIADLKFRTQKSSNIFCTGDTIKFTGTSGNDEYRFYVNNVLKETLTDSFYFEDQFADGDSAYVEASKGACDATSEIIYVSVIPVPDASFTFTNQGSMYAFKPTNENYKSYFWTFGDGLTSVLMTPDHSYKSSENETITAELDVVDNNDCSASTDQVIMIPDFTSVEELKRIGLKMYPSPAYDILHIEWNKTVISETRIAIYTPDGENVAMFTEDGHDISIDLSNIAVGIYIIEIQNDNVVTRQRLIKI